MVESEHSLALVQVDKEMIRRESSSSNKSTYRNICRLYKPAISIVTIKLLFPTFPHELGGKAASRTNNMRVKPDLGQSKHPPPVSLCSVTEFIDGTISKFGF